MRLTIILTLVVINVNIAPKSHLKSPQNPPDINDTVGELHFITISLRRLSFPRRRESMICAIIHQNFVDSRFHGNDNFNSPTGSFISWRLDLARITLIMQSPTIYPPKSLTNCIAFSYIAILPCSRNNSAAVLKSEIAF